MDDFVVVSSDFCMYERVSASICLHEYLYDSYYSNVHARMCVKEEGVVSSVGNDLGIEFRTCMDFTKCWESQRPTIFSS